MNVTETAVTRISDTESRVDVLMGDEGGDFIRVRATVRHPRNQAFAAIQALTLHHADALLAEEIHRLAALAGLHPHDLG